MTVYRAVTQISLNWPLELATSGGEITCTNSNNVTQLIKHLIRSAWPCPQVRLPVRIMTDTFYSSPITVVTSPGHHHTLPQSRTLIVFGGTHVTEGKGNA